MGRAAVHPDKQGGQGAAPAAGHAWERPAGQVRGTPEAQARRRQAAGRGAAQAANAPCAPRCLQAAAACARPSSPPAVPCRLQAIMGPSGSGKTTLLSALAGQLPYTPGMELRGSIILNGEALGKAKAQTGFVQQEDIFYSQLSVK